MTYKMKYKKGKGFPFKSSPTKMDVDLTKKDGLGPRANQNVDVEEDDVPLVAGFEDPIKIQEVQRKGLVPGSQTFNKKANVSNEKKKKLSNWESTPRPQRPEEPPTKKKAPTKMWGKVIDTAIGALKEDTAALERANNRNVQVASIQRK